MPIGATIGAIGSIGAAGIGYEASKNAAQTQADAATQAAQLQASEADKAQATQLQMFNTAQAAEQPYNTVGTGAINTLSGLYGINGTGAGTGTPNPASLQAFTNSPDYQFALNQGTQAMQRSAAAGGTLISGGQLKAGQEFGQGLASQQYGNYYNRLLSLAQIGQSAATGTSNAALTAGGQIGNTLTSAGAQIGNSIQGAGQATASGIVGGANAISGGLNGASSAIGTSLLASKLGIGGGNSSLSSYGGDSYGGGNFLTDAYGGSASSPLAGLSAADYG